MSGDQQRRLRIVATSAGHSWDLEERVVRASGDAEFVSIPCATEDDLIRAARGADGILASVAPFTRRARPTRNLGHGRCAWRASRSPRRGPR